MTAPAYTPAEMLDKLVGFDTTSRNSNLPLIEFVEDHLRAHGVSATRVPNADGSKANLIAVIGPAVAGGVVLSGHTDVVPTDGQDWESDPFALTARGGKLFGRGTCDMKAFSAAALSLVPRYVRMGLKRPVILALSYDEEIGCLGAHSLVDRLVADFPKPMAVVVGEPTNMTVVNAHKGIRAFRTTVTGHEAHSSNTHKGVSAVMAAAELLVALKGIGDMMRERGDPSGRFDPPFTSVQSSVISGGTALNILAKTCAFSWEYRPLPGSDEEEVRRLFDAFAENELLPRMRAVSPDTHIETRASAVVSAFRPEADSPAEALALSLTGRNACDAVSYGTEAGIFQRAGLSTVVCGPGDIAQAHQANEFVTEAQLQACTAFLARLGERLAG